MVKRDVKRIGIIVVSSDRGLCGGLNSNLFRKVLGQLIQWEKAGVEVDVCTIGTKAYGFFTGLNKTTVIGHTAKLGDSHT